MKKIALFLAVVCLTGLLCACSPEEKEPDAADGSAANEIVESPFIGTWVGDGTMDIFGLDHEIEFVRTWTFRSDGTATAEKTLDDGTELVLEYNYKFTENTLTFEKDGATCGITYVLEGDNLSILLDHRGNYAVFTRQ